MVNTSGDGFLEERLGALADDARFQERKANAPVEKGATVSEIGKVYGFSNPDWDPSEYVDQSGTGFLEERMNPLSLDSRFQKRKALNPVDKKLTVEEMGRVHGFRQPQWDNMDDSNRPFLDDSVNYRQPSSDNQGPAKKKLGPSEIGTISYARPKWSAEVDAERNNNAVGLFEEHIRANDTNYRQEIHKIGHKIGAQETGTIKYDAIDYTEQDTTGNFLTDRPWYESTAVSHELDDGLSWLLASLPRHRLQVFDKQELPSGYHSKIEFLKKLKAVIEEDMNEEDEKRRLMRRRLKREKALKLKNEQKIKRMQSSSASATASGDADNDNDDDGDDNDDDEEWQSDLEDTDLELQSDFEEHAGEHDDDNADDGADQAADDAKDDGDNVEEMHADDNTRHKQRRWLKYTRSQRMTKLNELNCLLVKMTTERQ